MWINLKKNERRNGVYKNITNQGNTNLTPACPGSFFFGGGVKCLQESDWNHPKMDWFGTFSFFGGEEFVGGRKGDRLQPQSSPPGHTTVYPPLPATAQDLLHIKVPMHANADSSVKIITQLGPIIMW